MDNARFDRLTKQLAGTRSRRGLLTMGLAGMAAAVGGGRSTAAAPYSVPLGGVCYRTRQCQPSTPDDSLNDLVYCADNDQWWDGEYNCCRYSGGRCYADGDCCGYLTCNAGYCSSRFDYTGPAYG